MNKLYYAQEIEDMFNPPQRANQKYDWHNLKTGMSFIIDCSEYSENYMGPEVPEALKKLGVKVSREKRTKKVDNSKFIVVTRIE